jgi:hypothetical protein
VTQTYDRDIDPIENGVQQAYQEIRESIELLLFERFGNVDGILRALDDAVSNNWVELMRAFWIGVRQDIELGYDPPKVENI